MKRKTYEELHRRNAYYWRKYRVTAEQVIAQYKWQKGRCAICENEVRVSGTKIFHLDHDHGTDKVRGLLCFSCNRLMGRMDRKKFMLSNLTTYIMAKGIWFEIT
jgi:hypothetical protein